MAAAARRPLLGPMLLKVDSFLTEHARPYGASRAQSSRFGASAWRAIGSRMDTVVSEATGQLRRQRLPSAA